MNIVEIKEAVFSRKEHREAIIKITDAYAQDPMGLGFPLPESAKEKMIRELEKFPLSLIFIAFYNGEAAGLATCFYGFSTFSAAKIINIHDLAVLNEYRGKGIGSSLLAAVEKKAKDELCCKITLEVREDNRARNLYEHIGFSYGEPRMYFMSKIIQ